MQNRVEVEIFDNKCVIVGEEDEEYIKSIAKYVDNKVREIIDQTKTTSTVRAVILAAINIADELFKTRNEHSSLKECLSKQEEELVLKIDEVIKLHE
ncbi:cell division protein ZapA [bacterium]|nr:cell division protein ZapA [bacterium]